MNALEKNIAVTRGEAIAAHLLATAALQAMYDDCAARPKAGLGRDDCVPHRLAQRGPSSER